MLTALSCLPLQGGTTNGPFSYRPAAARQRAGGFPLSNQPTTTASIAAIPASRLQPCARLHGMSADAGVVRITKIHHR